MTYRTFRTVLNRNTAYIAERSVPERLAALDVPVLVIFGAADRRWDPSSAHHYDAVPTAPVESESTAEMERALDSSLGADWNRLAGDVDWSCRQTGEHVAECSFSYALQVLAKSLDDYLPIEVKVLDEATPAGLLRSIVMCGEVLRLAVASASEDARAWHPYGISDREGFAAMGIVEVLVHTYDIAQGLDINWAPPDELCEPALLRLFPDAPQGKPSEVLLWCTGRAPLADRPRLETWRWDSSVRG